jgi:hypothetical protein
MDFERLRQGLRRGGFPGGGWSGRGGWFRGLFHPGKLAQVECEFNHVPIGWSLTAASRCLSYGESALSTIGPSPFCPAAAQRSRKVSSRSKVAL